jgi:hypothetical protein
MGAAGRRSQMRGRAPQLAAAAILALGAAACLALNWPGHFTWDSVMQLAEGRSGAWSGQHPPVMSWLLGLADAVYPGAALFVIFDVCLVFGGLVSLVLLSRPASWLAAPLAAALCVAPQLIVYPAIVWKDVLYAGASVAAFASLAWAVTLWPRLRARVWLLGLAAAFLTLASLTRQNGAVVLPFAGLALGLVAPRTPSLASMLRGAAWAVGLVLVAGALTLTATAALNTRLTNSGVLASDWRNLETYDLVGAVKRDPSFDLAVLHARAPWLEALLRRKAAIQFSPTRIDPMQPLLDGLDAHPEAAALIAAQWRALVATRPLLYLRGRGAAFRWVFLTPRPAACVMVETGVDGDDGMLVQAGLTERRTAMDNAMGDYAEALDRTPLYSHATYALAAAGLLAWFFIRRRPADIAMAAMLLSALAFAASFALISIACDYRYLYDLDLSTMAAALYAAASARGLFPRQRQREAGSGAGLQ